MAEDKSVYQIEEAKSILLAWVQQSESLPATYLTREGMAHVNGYLEGQNTMSLIKKEKYDILLTNFENLTTKYESLLIEHQKLLKKKNRFKFIRDFFKGLRNVYK